MYVILIDYTSELEDIDLVLNAYKIWLNESYAIGRLLVSGYRESCMGGAILATNRLREEIEAAVTKDPPALRGLAKHTIVEFRPSRVANDSLAKLFGDWRRFALGLKTPGDFAVSPLWCTPGRA